MILDLPQSEIDKGLRLLKLLKLHSRCSFDLELELQRIALECKDIDFLLANLTPLLNSSIQNIQSIQLQLHSIRRQKPPLLPN